MSKNNKLDKNNIIDIIGLTPLQEGMLFHYLREEGNVYNEQLRLDIEGNVDIIAFESAWKEVIRSNESLRTIFRWENTTKPLQIILKEWDFKLNYIDLTDSDFDVSKRLESIISSDSVKGFDLLEVPFRVSLIKTASGLFTIIISNHHILYDGWSNGIILKEFFHNYELLKSGIKPTLITKNSFKEYLKWLQSRSKPDTDQYWRKYLSDFEPTNLFGSLNGSELNHAKIKEIIVSVDEELYKRIEQLAQKLKVTTASIFYTTWGLLLQKYSNTNDVLFGTPVSGRNAKIKDIEDIVGLFINTIPLRYTKQSGNTISELILNTDLNLRERAEYEHSSLSEIKNASKITARNELFETLVIIENYPLDVNKLKDSGGLQIKSYSIVESTNYPLTVTIKLFGKVEICFGYYPDIVDSKLMDSISDQFIHLLEETVKNPQKEINSISIVSSEEKKLILTNFNNTFAKYPKEKSICQLFEEQVKLTPDKIAIKIDENSLTYSELNKQSNQIARLLKAQNIQNGSFVGILLDRSCEMIVSIIAVLKAGGAYLPIDPEYPEERIRYMIEDSGAQIVLTQQKNYSKLTSSSLHDNFIDIYNIDLSHYETSNLELNITSDSLAYVIYTSGSTGNPKGVLIDHKNVLNFVTGVANIIDFSVNKTILCLTTISFDIFVLETILPLLKGLSIEIADELVQRDASLLHNLLANKEVDMLQMTPSRLKLLMNYDSNLSMLENINDLMLGGEALPEELFFELRKKYKGKIYNMYGPTETTVWSTIKDLTLENKVTIGRPIANTQVLILNKDGIIQPVGVVGEICIAGDGLSRGYYNNETLTLEKFVYNTDLNKKIYKTGDLGKWLPDGDIQCLGRIDFQVKIRGYRIELEEIEKRLEQHSEITTAVVIAKEDKYGIYYLCAYYVSEGIIEQEKLVRFLAQSLPDYMIPSFFVRLDEIPLTPNGKTDRNALPEPERVQNQTIIQPKNQTEEKMRHIWSRMLGIAELSISTETDFFSIGGHSLNATSLIAQINKLFNVQLPMKQLFETPNIKELSAFVDNSALSQHISITQAEFKNNYPASSSQKRLFILQQFEKNFTGYNMPAVIEITGSLNIEKVKGIFNIIYCRHESLRTTFEFSSDNIVQKINDANELPLEILETTIDNELDLNDVIQKFVNSFDLANGPLFRVNIITLHKKKHFILIDMHHIVVDGLSQKILTDEFKHLYQGYELDKPLFQFKDFSEWQQKTEVIQQINSQQKYWKELFNEDIPILNLPNDYERPKTQNFEGKRIDFTVDSVDAEKIKILATNEGVSNFMLLLGLFKVFLARISGQEDIVVGVPVSGRRNHEIQQVVGMFVNTLPIRSKISMDLSFKSFLRELKSIIINAFENQDFKYDELLENLEIKRDPSRNPLFDVLFTYEIDNFKSDEIDGLNINCYPVVRNISKFDITLECKEINNGFNFQIEYATSLFKHDTILRFIGYYKQIIKSFIENPTGILSEADILSNEEKILVVNKFNATTTVFPKDKYIFEWFEEQAAKTPDNIAIQHGDRKITYKELSNKINSLTRLLVNRNIAPDTTIGIVAERSIELIVGIYAILKSGVAYLPIDPKYPADRIKYILEDSETKLILCPSLNQLKIEGNFEFIDINLNTTPDKNTVEVKSDTLSLNSLAYVIYTSGSTGKPKGVMVEHSQLLNIAYTLNKDYPLNENDKYLFKTPCIFDVSISEIFGWFFNGGSLVILENEAEKDPFGIMEAIHNYKITHINFVPSLFNVFVDSISAKNIDYLSSLKYVFLAGEAVSPSSVIRFLQFNTPTIVENLYGPTEATVYASGYPLNKWDSKREVPIGKPLANVGLFILNKYGQLQGIGIEGELCISGDGLSRGYLNNSTLTNEKFFSCNVLNGKRLYKTGDLAKWTKDGNILYKGRIDHQVKIRGFRIELGEIESQLNLIEGIKECIVNVFAKDDGDKYLCAYYVCDKLLESSELKSALSNVLPEYMIPSYFIHLQSMPLTLNGKVDRKALPQPELLQVSELEQPENKTQQELLKLWSKVLSINPDKIGINSSFFDLGGHSLKAITLLAKIREELNVHVSLSDLFKFPTIKRLELALSKQEGSNFTPIQTAPLQEYYQLTSSQKRIFILQEMDKSSMVYNMPALFAIKGDVDKSKLESAFMKLIEKHESLRTSFNIVKNQPVQYIHDNVSFNIHYINIDDNGIEKCIKSISKPFDLSEAPLFRVYMLKSINNENYLFVDFHHIIFDGYSRSILLKDIEKMYLGEPFDKLAVQYKDYVYWQKMIKESVQYKKQEEYWLLEFSGILPKLKLPYDYPVPLEMKKSGSLLNFKINKNLTNSLRNIAKSEETTLNIILLSAYKVLFSRINKQNDIIIGISIAGRERSEFQNIIGMFVNTVAIRSQINKNDTFSNFVQVVQRKLALAYDNQDYAFDELVDTLKIEKSINKNPIFNVAFSFQNKEMLDSSSLQFKLEQLEIATEYSRFEITLFAMESENEIICDLEYSTELFNEETVKLFSDRFLVLLDSICQNPECVIENLDYRTSIEHELIVDTNAISFDF
jgi:tyrocidine synthetase-3